MSRAAEWILTARQAIALVDQIKAGDIGRLTQGEVVALGQRLWWLSKHVDALMEQIKTRMRREASARPKEQQRFEAPDQSGHCVVVPSPPTVEVKPDANMSPTRRALGAQFADYFSEEKVYKPRKDFQERFLQATPAEQEALLEVVTLNPRLSRIMFKD